MRTGLILGIESSCDETAAAVVRAGSVVLANVVASQMRLHAEFGGVVPELASREHLRNIVPVVRRALSDAGTELAELDAIAVTEGPGLAGALLVGITFAKALAAGLGKPLIAVNHLEGHIHAVLMDQSGTGAAAANAPGDGCASAPGRPRSGGRLLALVASGGHTHLYLCEPKAITQTAEAPAWRFRNVGRTVDDAAGEAYDKVAKLLGLGYPGGPWLDALAPLGDPKAIPFRFRPLRRAPGRQRPGEEASSGEPGFDFSFSGIKTAVLRHVQQHGMAQLVEARRSRLADAMRARPDLSPQDAVRQMPELFDRETLDLIASFQGAVVGNLLQQTIAATRAFAADEIVVSGGVAANRELRRRFAAEAARLGLGVAFPAVALATDNAAMIAAAGWGKLLAGEFSGDELQAAPALRLA